MSGDGEFLLFSERRLDRERALTTLTESDQDRIETALSPPYAAPWATLCGALDGAVQLKKKKLSAALALATHAEPRVRDAARRAIAAFCRDSADANACFGPLLAKTRESLTTRAVVEANVPPSQGWRLAEAAMQALDSVIRGCGSAAEEALLSRIDAFAAIVVDAREHDDRFVREAAFSVLDAALLALPGKDLGMDAVFGPLVRKGLADNWSQVRHAASVACRSLFVVNVGGDEKRKAALLDVLLPPMALNRHYVAEGVRVYSQSTWITVLGEGARHHVEARRASLVEYYESAADADNHAVREAAAACISELLPVLASESTPKDEAQTLAQQLAAIVLQLFGDGSWPVRDAACRSGGELLRVFGGVLKEEQRNALLGLCVDHVHDNIWSVREHAAEALGAAMNAADAGVQALALARAEHLMETALHAAFAQKEESTALGNLGNVTQFGVAPPRSPAALPLEPKVASYANDVALHTDAQAFSCGSLAPRMKKRGVGCMDHGFARAAEEWERSDGAVYIVRELARKNPTDARLVSTWVPALAKLAALTHFRHAAVLAETVWKQLPRIAEALGADAFGSLLPLFTAEPFAAAVKSTRLVHSTASYALQDLRDLVGGEKQFWALVGKEDEELEKSLKMR